MYVCHTCHYQSPTKLGKCPSCNSFGTFGLLPKEPSTTGKKQAKQIALQPVSDYQLPTSWTCTAPEIRRVFQDKIMQGAAYLLAGEPGIGKSTLVLQIINDIIANADGVKIAYFTGEETPQHVAARYSRLYPKQPSPRHIFHTTVREDVELTAREHQYDIIIIDSIQTITSTTSDASAGSPLQVRTCADFICDYCKRTNTTALIIGHITKGGDIAGPKYLEHIVDVVVSLEGDRESEMRFLRTYKNRYGHTDEVGILQMSARGLIPIPNFSQKIRESGHAHSPGSVLTIGLDNGRPLLARVECLLSKSYGKFPTRRGVGVDTARLDMIIAILTSYLGYKLGQYDIYINIPGESRLGDSGIDLAIAASIVSQYTNTPIPGDRVVVGELRLNGHVVACKRHEKRMRELPAGMSFLDHHSCQTIRDLPALISHEIPQE